MLDKYGSVDNIIERRIEMPKIKNFDEHIGNPVELNNLFVDVSEIRNEEPVKKVE